MLEAIKSALGITGDYQDATLTQYINEVKAFMIDGGVATSIVESSEAYGVIARGVADLWNYGSGGTSFSTYFIQRVTQLAMKEGVASE